MDEHGQVQAIRLGEHLVEGAAVQEGAVDVGTDLHAPEPELLHLFQGGGGQLGVLHGQDPERVEVLTDLGAQPLVHLAAVGISRLGIGPVAEQLGHGSRSTWRATPSCFMS